MEDAAVVRHGDLPYLSPCDEKLFDGIIQFISGPNVRYMNGRINHSIRFSPPRPNQLICGRLEALRPSVKRMLIRCRLHVELLFSLNLGSQSKLSFNKIRTRKHN